jgi:phosphate transport system substrate-binding protein
MYPIWCMADIPGVQEKLFQMKSYRRFNRAIFFICFLTFVAGCRSYESQDKELIDTKDRGTIHISADESFQPVVDELVRVYESHHPQTKIIVHYKPEAECFNDFGVDSIRVIIATRGFSPEEREFIVDSLHLAPQKMIVARDAVAVIVNPASPDSLFTKDELIQVLKGNFKRNLIPVFDGIKATSTVRFIIDSVLRGDSLTPKAVAARTSEGVIDYIAKTRDAVGFIGVSWIGNPDDTAQLSFLKKVRIGAIESVDRPEWYVKPYQANIYTRRYRMVRDLVYTLKENHKGLGHGFTSFMSGEIGQKIFKRAYLFPARMNLNIQVVRVTE